MNYNNFFRGIKDLKLFEKFLYNKKELFYFEENKVIKGLKNALKGYYSRFYYLFADEMDKVLRLIETSDLNNIKNLKPALYDMDTMLLIVKDNKIKAIDLLKQEIVELSEREKAIAYDEIYDNPRLDDKPVIELLKNNIINVKVETINDLILYITNQEKKCEFIGNGTKEEKNKLKELVNKRKCFFNKSCKLQNNFNYYRTNYCYVNKDKILTVTNYTNDVNLFSLEQLRNKQTFYELNASPINYSDVLYKINNDVFIINNIIRFASDELEIIKIDNDCLKYITKIELNNKTDNLRNVFIAPTKEELINYEIKLCSNYEDINIDNCYSYSSSHHIKVIINDFYYYNCKVKNMNLVGYHNKIYYVPYESDFNPFNEITDEILKKAEKDHKAFLMLRGI